MSKSLPSSLPPIMISDLTIYPSSTIRCYGFLLDSSLLILKFSLLFFVIFTYVVSDRSLLISMMPLNILVCSFVLSRLDYFNSLHFNLPKSSLYPLKLSTLRHAWSLILLNSPISLHLLSIFTGYLSTFAFSSKTVLSCIKFFILLRFPIFLTS